METYTSLSVPFLRDNPPIPLLQNPHLVSTPLQSSTFIETQIQGNRNKAENLVF